MKPKRNRTRLGRIHDTRVSGFVPTPRDAYVDILDRLHKVLTHPPKVKAPRRQRRAAMIAKATAKRDRLRLAWRRKPDALLKTMRDRRKALGWMPPVPIGAKRPRPGVASAAAREARRGYLRGLAAMMARRRPA